MDAQRTPDELNAENGLICEKLLGWQRRVDPVIGHTGWYPAPIATSGGKLVVSEVPDFTVWAEAGLILDAIQRMRLVRELRYLSERMLVCELTPSEVRQIALAYIRSLS